MNIITYTENGFSNKSKEKSIIKIDNCFFSIHNIINENLSLNQAKKSIPFNLEENLLDDIDNLKFFIKKKNHEFNIVVIAKNTIKEIKDFIKNNNLNINGIYLSFMFIPFDDGKINYQINDDKIIFRESEFSGGELEQELFFSKFKDADLIELKNKSRDYHKINLLTYDIKKIIQPWIKIIIPIAFIIIISILNAYLQNLKYQENLQILNNNNQQLFKLTFPHIQNIVDMKIQAQQEMSALSTQKKLNEDDFLKYLLEKDLKNTNIKVINFKNTVLEIK